ncbi:MAG TPA: hypothetical protein VLK85_02065 [Ramlibacter sp.]|nr:hypothetical protein [Ramlibacter sp.]
MKTFALLAVVGGLSGCVAYAVPDAGGYPAYGARAPYYGGGPYVASPPVIVQPQAPRGRRDRDRDGVPNRYDRDRDGDGVPNRMDASPDDRRRW